MGFNPFVWNNTQPSPNQLISDGQTTLLNNTNFLGSTSGRALPGFIQFPNGIIVQWKQFNLTSADDDVALTHPIAFPNSCFDVQIHPVKDSGNSKRVFLYLKSFASITNVNFTIRYFVTDAAGAVIPNEAIGMTYMAIGF